jgi:uncharacterized alkaline shock family protein YloU
MTDAPKPEPASPGKVTIAPDVLVTIARLSTMSVPGVVRMSPIPGGVDRLFQRGQSEGIRIEVKNNTVRVDVHLIIAHDANVRDVSRGVQAAVARTIQETLGMDVLAVNVHIEDVSYPEAPKPAS